MDDAVPSNWKLLLRYGRLETPFQHFTVIVDVRVIKADKELGSRVGPAWMSMKVWAADVDSARELIAAIAPEVGAELHGRIEVYGSEPEEPPRGQPFAYDPGFVAFDS